MRLTLLAVIVFATAAPAADPPKKDFALRSELTPVLGLPLPESEKPVYGISLTAKVNEKGDWSGVLALDSTAPVYDELGTPIRGPAVAPVKLDCSLKFEKEITTKHLSGPPSRPDSKLIEVKWKLYSITGPKITSKLFVATSNDWAGARFLVHDDKGKVKHAVELHVPPRPPIEPCHPGCFPAGTPILLPDGSTTVEKVRAGDAVTTIGSNGIAGKARVESVFVTNNRLIEVKTASGTLVTTETQPLALADGGLREAGELRPGDKIWRWDGKQRQSVEVKSVIATGIQPRPEGQGIVRRRRVPRPQ
jgi:hypothetical protein